MGEQHTPGHQHRAHATVQNTDLTESAPSQNRRHCSNVTGLSPSKHNGKNSGKLSFANQQCSGEA